MDICLASWNVNGIRAAAGKEGWQQWFSQDRYDVIGFQEIKASEDQLPKNAASKEGYEGFFNPSVVKKGYSGTAVYTRIKPVASSMELPDPAYQGEGRIIHLEFERFHFINGYFPNGGSELLDDAGKPTGKFKRVPFKMGFFECFLNYAQALRKSKPVVVCGDFNIAHEPIDLARPQSNEGNTGFLPEERAFLDRFMQHGYIDTFRKVKGDIPGQYSWWSYRMRAREKNVGWRIDYFFVSDELEPNIKDAWIENTVTGSDHCPIGLSLSF